MNLDNQPLFGGDTPLPNTFNIPDSFGAEDHKILEAYIRIKNYLSFINIVASDYREQLKKETDNGGVSLFPFIEEEQIKQSANKIAREIFCTWKKEGYFDKFNRFSEKFYNLKEAQNAS